MTTEKKGYVMTFIRVTSPDFKEYPPMVPATLEPYGGKIVKRALFQDKEIYTENCESYMGTILIEFPSLEKAVTWYNSDVYKKPKALRQSTSTGPFAIFEGEDYGDAVGLLLGFITVADKEKMATYAPGKSIALFKGKVLGKATPDKLAIKEPGPDDFHFALVVSFPTTKAGKDWMESAEYKEAKEIRLAATTGVCAVI